MRRVILESPYAGDVEENVKYARACLRDCLLRGEAPIASHLLYTQPGVLKDEISAERQHGIDAGLVWGSVAEATVVYVDRGISRGMQYGIANAEKAGRPVEYRWIYPVKCEKCGEEFDAAATRIAKMLGANRSICKKCSGLREDSDVPPSQHPLFPDPL